MAAADFGRIKVGADCLIDKKSLKYGTDVGQYLVVSKIHPSSTPSLCGLSFLALTTEADKDVCAGYLKAQANEEHSKEASLKSQFERIIASHLASPPMSDIKRGSWSHISSKWRDLCSPESPSDSGDDLVGKIITMIAVHKDGEPVIIFNARVERKATAQDEQEGASLALRPQPRYDGTDGVADLVFVAVDRVRAAISMVPPSGPLETVDGSALPPHIIAHFNRMQVTASVGRPAQLALSDVTAFLAGAGIELDEGADAEAPAERDARARASIKSVYGIAKINKISPDLEPSPVDPTRFGQRLAGAHRVADQLAEERPLPPAKPPAEVFRSLASSAPEWDKFVHASVTTTVSDPDKRAETRLSAERASAALGRTLARFGTSVASVRALGADKSQSADQLLCFLDALADKHAAQPLRQAASAEPGPSLLAPPGSRPDMRTEGGDADVRLSLTASALAMVNDAPSVALFEQYYLAAQADPAKAQTMLNTEENEHVLRLLSTPIDDVEKLLQGVLSHSISTKVLAIRRALGERVERIILGKDYEPSEDESAQIRRAHRGDLSKVDLLKLIGKQGSASRLDPLGGFAQLQDHQAGECFALGINRLEKVLLYSRPSQAQACMSFFSLLVDTLSKARRRGATWADCSRFYASLLKKVQFDVKEFASAAAGSKASSAVLNFDSALVTDYQRPYFRLLEEAIIDNKRGGKGKGKDRGKEPKVKSKGERAKRKPDGQGKGKKGKKPKKAAEPEAEGEDDADDEADADAEAKVPGTFIPDNFGKAAKKMFAEAADKHGVSADGKIACGFHMKGSCTRGDNCHFWHDF